MEEITNKEEKEILKQKRIANAIAEELNVRSIQVEKTIELIDGGNTIPFIARYRKEVTGGLSDETLRDLGERLTYLRNLESRKEEVKKSIEEQGKLTEELSNSIENSKTLAEVEDIYRPYKPKKKTRATVAKAKGLEPLAKIIIEQKETRPLEEIAKEYINIEKLSEEDNLKTRQILVERNLRLVVYIAKKFENTGIGIEDLISIGTIGLMKGVNTFNAEKNIKLATYASRCIENEILMYLRKNNKIKGEISIDEPLNKDCDGNELLLSDILGTDPDITSRKLEDEVDKKLLKASILKLNQREKDIMEMRFGFKTGKEKTQKEVADELRNITKLYIKIRKENYK